MVIHFNAIEIKTHRVIKITTLVKKTETEKPETKYYT